MKKFFKALAVVLALTLVIGTVPASAATTPKAAESKVLYVDGSKGFKLDADGDKVASKLGAKVKLYKLAGLTKAQAADYTITAKSDDTTVVRTTSVNAKAVAMGTANVTIYVDGEKLGVTKITVKQSASDDTFKYDAPATVSVGEEFTVSLPRKGVDTDARRLSCADENVTITDNKNRTYTVKIAAPGEYTLKAEAFQSKTYNGATATAEIKVTAALPTLEEIAQVASNAVALKFSGDASAYTKNDFNVYYMAGDAKVYGNVVNTIELDETKTIVVVTFFTAFTAKTEYTVIAGTSEMKFTAAGNSADDVTSVKINGKATVYVNEESDEYTLSYFNAAGIDITETVDESKFTVTFSANDAVDGYFGTNNKIYFWAVGGTATVKAKVEKLNDKYEYETVAEDSMKVTCIDTPSKEYKDVAIWSFTAKDDDRIDTKATANTTLAVGDERAFQVIFNGVQGTAKFTTDVKAGDPGYRFESSDPTIVIVTGKDVNDSPVVFGVKQGTAYIKIYSYDTTNKIDSLITAIPVEVKAARKATTITPTWEKANFNNDAPTADHNVLTVVVKDQYGDPYYNATQPVKIKTADNYRTNLGGWAETTLTPDANVAKNAKWTIDAAGTVSYVKDGNYPATLTSGDATAATSLAVIEQNDASKVNGYKLTGLKDIDVAVTAASAGMDDMILKLTETYNGYYMQDVATIDFVDATPIPVTGAAAEKFEYTVAKNGSIITSLDAIEAFNGATDVVDAFKTSTVITKAAVGTYTISIYKRVASSNAAACKVTRLDTITFKITDSQPMPTYTQVQGKVDYVLDEATVTTDLFKECFQLTFDGTTYDADWTKATTGAIAKGYDVVGVTTKLDKVNKTIVFTDVTLRITNNNADPAPANELNGKTITLKVPVSGIVYGK